MFFNYIICLITLILIAILILHVVWSCTLSGLNKRVYVLENTWFLSFFVCTSLICLEDARKTSPYHPPVVWSSNAIIAHERLVTLLASKNAVVKRKKKMLASGKSCCKRELSFQYPQFFGPKQSVISLSMDYPESN